MDNTILEIKKLKEKLLNDGLKNFSENLNNLFYAIDVLTKPVAENTSNTFIKPMVGRISAPFGEKRTNSKGQVYYHTGIDLADNPSNKTPIYASASGKIIESGDQNDGYGNKIIIDHGGVYKSLYAHCSVLKVKTGDQVKQGQEIAIVGSTGHSTGPHLHFEIIKNGVKVDPETYI